MVGVLGDCNLIFLFSGGELHVLRLLRSVGLHFFIDVLQLQFDRQNFPFASLLRCFIRERLGRREPALVLVVRKGERLILTNWEVEAWKPAEMVFLGILHRVDD